MKGDHSGSLGYGMDCICVYLSNVYIEALVSNVVKIGVYIAVFGVAFLYSGSLWFLFIMEVPPCGWGWMSDLSRFPG